MESLESPPLVEVERRNAVSCPSARPVGWRSSGSCGTARQVVWKTEAAGSRVSIGPLRQPGGDRRQMEPDTAAVCAGVGYARNIQW